MDTALDMRERAGNLTYMRLLVGAFRDLGCDGTEVDTYIAKIAHFLAG